MGLSSGMYLCMYLNKTNFVQNRFHPHFPNIVRSRIAQLMGVDYKVQIYFIRMNAIHTLFQFDLMLSTDGSGRGAALVAAVLFGQCTI